MPIQVACPNCGATYKVPDECLGRSAKCARCQQSFAALPTALPATPAPPAAIPLPATRPAPVATAPSAAVRAVPALAVPAVAEPAGAPGQKLGGLPILRLAGHKVPVLYLAIAGSAAAIVLFMTISAVGYLLLRGKKSSGTETVEVSATKPSTESRVTGKDPVLIDGQLAPEVLQRVKRATVYLRVTLPDGGIAQGSGFFAIEPAVVLTNAHVIGMLESESKTPRTIEGTINSGLPDERKFSCQVLGVDRNSDLAVLRATANAGTTLPPPLEVKSARGLTETQKVFVFGFPFGSQLGKEISVRASSVASLRKDKSGDLRQVQCNDGMDPGNSGGPVVDVRGDVVGVAVSVITGSSINFAVPGDQVRTICNGRVSSVSIGQPYVDNGRTLVPVTLHKIDPLGRMQQCAVEVWTGARGDARPATRTPPAAQAGDSPRQRLTLENRPQEAAADVALPALPGGKIYWVQPMWNGAGGDAWAAAASYEMTGPPVERKAAMLQVKHQAGDRPLSLFNRATWKFAAGIEDRTIAVDLDSKLQETTQGIDPQGTAAVRWQYKDFAVRVTEDNQDRPLGPRTQRLTKEVPLLAAALQIDKQGILLRHELDATRVPTTSRKDVQELHQQIHGSVEAISVPWPNRLMQPQTSWKAMRALPIDAFGRNDTGALDMTYTFLGTRSREGRQEAVIGLSGQLRGPPRRESLIVGRADGTAVLDLSSGQVSQVDAKVVLDMDVILNGHVSKANAILDYKFQRNVK